MSASKKVILFDGVCNLCNGAVQFIIKRDSKKFFFFASLQSSYGQQLLRERMLGQTLETIILLKDHQTLQKSDAALEIARHLSGAWPALYVFKLVPRFIRDGVYQWIARNRYRFFGKRDACMVPTAELKSRFLA